MDHNEFIDAYGTAVDEKRAVVVVGAGLSIPAGLPPWDDLLNGIRTELNLPDSYQNFPMLAQFLENQPSGRRRLVAEVCKLIGRTDLAPADGHRLLAALPVRDIWTTNYDVLIEQADPDAEVIERDEELIEARTDVRRIYKMHGSIHPAADTAIGGDDRLVLSRDDFDHYESTHPRFWSLLQAKFLTASFLFVGYSLTDPNFQTVLRLVRTRAPDIHVQHYAVLRRQASDGGLFDNQANDLRRAGVNVVEISDHDEVPMLLERLVARTRPSRLFISGSLPTGTPPVDDVDVVNQPYPAVETLDDKLSAIADQLGGRLAVAGISVTTGGQVGATVGYALMQALPSESYDPGRLVVVRRARNETISRPSMRLGTIEFTGTHPGAMRGRAFEQVRATLVIRGGTGTRAEVERARELGMGIVPLACSGGTARTVWEEMHEALDSHDLGGRPIDPDVFENLNHPDLGTALDAAVLLVKQAMYQQVDSQRATEHEGGR